MQRPNPIATADAPPCATAPTLKREKDPAILAYNAWRATFDVYTATANDRQADHSDEFIAPFFERQSAAHDVLCETVATTAAGLAKQLRAAFYVFGDVGKVDDWHDPTLYDADSFNHTNGKRMLLSLLAGAERLALEGA